MKRNILKGQVSKTKQNNANQRDNTKQSQRDKTKTTRRECRLFFSLKDIFKLNVAPQFIDPITPSRRSQPIQLYENGFKCEAFQHCYQTGEQGIFWIYSWNAAMRHLHIPVHVLQESLVLFWQSGSVVCPWERGVVLCDNGFMTETIHSTH